MNSVRKDKLFNDIFYFLITIFVILIIFYLYKYSSYTNHFKRPKGNVIDVSPLTGESIKPVMSSTPLYEVIYAENIGIQDLSHLSSADIIYESYDTNLQLPLYKAVFFNKKPVKTSSTRSIKSIPLNNMVKFNFISSEGSLPSYYNNKGEILFVEFNSKDSSSFLYEGGKYYHVTHKSRDIDKVNNKPLSASNVIIQFVKENSISSQEEGFGDALICSGGVYAKAQWAKEKDRPLKLTADSEKEVTLMKGTTWWITVVQGSTVLVN
ncbi:DUF3048 C-terminal domain-containing protein [Clostridium polynesiense]|uniref:DUF3048 C-terminal domain-containing protein n=1 Tax=Clostridium polynesiense TaxID=1325933 RepID=UPI00058C6DBF|nr:DUF3048 C-terminal domain-containing protein [Clostridium polynesiense]